MDTRNVRMSATLALAISLAACGAKPESAKAPPAHSDEKVVNVYSWLDYIAPDTVANFERETGIKVRYDM